MAQSKDNEANETQSVSTAASAGPRHLDEFGGQADLVRRVGGMVETCHAKHVAFPHALLIGPVGIGKRSLAHVIARELGVNLHVTDAELIERASDLAEILNNLEEHDVLFIDSIGRLRREVAQRLESVMREFEFHIVVGEGMGARTFKIALKPFTLLGSVTQESQCDSRIRRAFPMAFKFKPYSEDEMQAIAERMTSRLGISLEPETLAVVVRAAKGNPGEASNIITQLSTHGGSQPLTHAEAAELLNLFGIPVGPVESVGASADFASLTPVDFEHLVADLLRLMGFETQTTKATGDGGIDVEAVLEKRIVGGRYLFQCKRYAPENPVGSAAVREFYGALVADRKAVKGVFITTSTFTPQARQFAQDLPIELIDGEQLERLLEEMHKSPSSE